MRIRDRRVWQAPDGNAGSVEGTGGTPQPEPQPGAWREALPEDLRASPTLADVEAGTVEEAFGKVAKQFVDQQAYFGNAIRVPGPDAGEEARQQFYQDLLAKAPGVMVKPSRDDAEAQAAVYNALGRPESHEGYTLPEGAEIPGERLQALHGLGLTQTQLEGVLALETQTQEAATQQAQEAFQAGHEALQTEWGQTYEPRKNAVGAFLERTGAPAALVEVAKGGHMGADALKWFHNIVEKFGPEGRNFQDPSVNNNAVMTPAEAELRIREIRNNPDYTHHDFAVRKPLIDEVQRLQKFAKPDSMHGEEAERDLRRSIAGDSG